MSYSYDDKAFELGAAGEGRYAGGRLLYKFKKQANADIFVAYVKQSSPHFRVTRHPKAIKDLWFVNIEYN